MKIIQSNNRYWLQSKCKNIHATSYSSESKAALAAGKIAHGLIHFQPLSKNIKTWNNTNPT